MCRIHWSCEAGWKTQSERRHGPSCQDSSLLGEISREQMKSQILGKALKES